MRNNLIKIILGITGVACFLFTYKPAVAEVYSQFQSIGTRNWEGDFRLPDSLQAKFVILNDRYNNIDGRNDFRFYPNPSAAHRADSLLDDGYAMVPLGFTYRFNGENYREVYVSINGFVTFIEPRGAAEVTRDPGCLFKTVIDGSTGSNIIAPYWGDHKYWPENRETQDSGKAASQIGYVQYTYRVEYPAGSGDTLTKKAILIQWLNLNVNYCDRGAAYDGTDFLYLRDVASFQLIIYEGPDDIIAQQGSVEFRYGSFGPTDGQRNSPGWSLPYHRGRGPGEAKGASVGIKGIISINSDKSDFVNALYTGWRTEYPYDIPLQRNSTKLAIDWPPSGDPARAIYLDALYAIAGNENWGDGDADMSQAGAERHNNIGTPQNRFVTMNDVRTIMLSMVTGNKLDSVYKQAAFHADVNHDGRYYFLTNRNSGIYRYNRTSANPVRDYTPYTDIPDGQGGVIKRDQNISRDTFWLTKVGTYSGDFGFKEYYGKNDEFIEIDFIDAPFGLAPLYSTRRYNIIDNAPTSDYQIRITYVDDRPSTTIPYRPSDKDLLWMASEDNINDRIERIHIRLKKNIVWKDSLLNATDRYLPGIVDLKTDIYYQTNELDASLIMAWLGGQIGWLPWIWENPNHDYKGKITTPYKIATNIAFNNDKIDGDNIILPIYYNGTVDKNQAVKFNFNTDVVNIEQANANVKVEYSNNTKTAVIISDGSFSPNMPIAHITLPKNVSTFEATNVRFYGEKTDNVSYKLATGKINNNILSCSPNPATTFTEIKVNIPVGGTYRIAVYDNNGNLINEVANSNFEIGTYTFNWDCTKIVSGTYFYTLDGANTSVTNSLVIAR